MTLHLYLYPDGCLELQIHKSHGLLDTSRLLSHTFLKVTNPNLIPDFPPQEPVFSHLKDTTAHPVAQTQGNTLNSSFQLISHIVYILKNYQIYPENIKDR